MSEAVMYYFAYGSNMSAERVNKRKMIFFDACAGTLNHHELRFNKRSVKFPGAASANVMAVKNAQTQGVLYQLSEADQILMMDPFEGYPTLYDRLALPVATAMGDLTAWVYIANVDHIQEGLAPAQWYLNHLLAGESYLTPSYFEALRATNCLPGSDTEPA